MRRFAILGSGSWATALAKILTDNDVPIIWWFRKQENLDFIKEHKHNKLYLPQISFFGKKIDFSNDFEWTVKQADVLVIATPSKFIIDIIGGFYPAVVKEKIIISAVKGLVQSYERTINNYLEYFNNFNLENYIHISGPCHAEEIANEKKSYLTFSCKKKSFAKEISKYFANAYVSIKTSKDLEGTELASALKNVYAIAVGISLALGYGDNFRAVLVSESVREMQRFLSKSTNSKRKILNSAYLGDTIVTCYSPHSRNRQLGILLGEGKSLEEALTQNNMVAEGFYSTKVFKSLSKRNNVKCPILSAVFKIIYENESAKEIFKELEKELN
jgi:glycerol-3-phosphate dehydrogenase (NAD(P)+)